MTEEKDISSDIVYSIPIEESDKNIKPKFYAHVYDRSSSKNRIARQYRITTDQIPRIINDDLFVLDEILGDKVVVENPASKWYNDHIETARQRYSGHLSKDVQRTQTGLCVHSSYPWLAANIGEFADDGDMGKEEGKEKKEKKEIKRLSIANFWSPYSQKMPKETPGDYILKTAADLQITKREIGDIIIWTPYDCRIATVKKDNNEWRNFTFPKIKAFYQDKVIPAMIDSGIDPKTYYVLDLKEYYQVF